MTHGETRPYPFAILRAVCEEWVKVFDQTFFKKFVGFGAKPQGLEKYILVHSRSCFFMLSEIRFFFSSTSRTVTSTTSPTVTTSLGLRTNRSES